MCKYKLYTFFSLWRKKKNWSDGKAQERLKDKEENRNRWCQQGRVVLAICIYHHYYCLCPTHIPFHLILQPSSASSPLPLSAFPSCPNPFMAGLPPTRNEWQVELLIRYKLTWLEMLNYSGRKMGSGVGSGFMLWHGVCSLKWGDSGQDRKAFFFSFKSKMMKIIPTNEASKSDCPPPRPPPHNPCPNLRDWYHLRK